MHNQGIIEEMPFL